MLVRGIAYETPDINLIKFGQKVEIHLDICLEILMIILKKLN